MRICLIIREFWPLKGGLTLHALRLGQELAGLGHRFEVVTPFVSKRPGGNNMFWATEISRDFVNEGVLTHVVGLGLAERLFLLPLKKLQWRSSTRFIAKAMLRLVYVKKFEKYFAGNDLVHYDGAGMEFLGFAAAKAARNCGKPFLVQPSVHLGQWGHLPVDFEFFCLADGFLVHSEVEKNYLHSVTHRKVPVHLVYNGIDDILAGNGERFRAKHEISSRIILYLGRKDHDKGYFLARQAFQKISAQKPEIHLVCAGPGEGLPSTEKITELAYISEQDKADALNACEFVCVPSEGESFGLVFLEAGRARKPYLARDLELFEDLLGPNLKSGVRVGSRHGDGRVGLNVEQLERAIFDLLSLPPEKRQEMGDAGFVNAARFLWPVTVQRFLDAYSDTIDQISA